MVWVKGIASAAVLVSLASGAQAQQSPPARNLVLFVPDGLRSLAVTPASAPTLAALRDRGVDFRNPHSLFPTFTMANGSAMATGHRLGDTGVYSNAIFTGYPVGAAGGSVTPFIENDAVLGDIDAHFEGNYLDEETILAAARAKGFSTAAIGKLGPTLQFDHTARTGEQTIVVDDATGSPSGIPFSPEMTTALNAAGLPLKAPPRGENGKAGDFRTPGTSAANVEQQAYFADVAATVVLPLFRQRNRPFLLVFWSRDPDGTQHVQGDSLNSLVPGINGPTVQAALRNMDDNLARLRAALDALGLGETTDIVVSADHGFSTISKESATSPAAKGSYEGVVPGRLPPGFLAIDLARALDLPLHDPDAKNAPVGPNAHPRMGNGLLGPDPAKPDVVVAANGGSDLVYLPNKDAELARRIVTALAAQDYASGIFADDALGPIPGTLPMSAVGLEGDARTPRPSLVVNFRSHSTGCDQPLLCAVSVADTRYQQGQGMHGSFSRADTMNFMAAEGPSFKRGFADGAPVSNADVGRTIAHLLDLPLPTKGRLIGRIIAEALPGGAEPTAQRRTLRSEPGPNGLSTVLQFQALGDAAYFDAAGYPGRTLGLGE